MPPIDGEWTLFDAGLFIGALLAGDSRHKEARPLIESAAAIASNVSLVFTYDPDDWLGFENEGLRIAGPASTLIRLGRQ